PLTPNGKIDKKALPDPRTMELGDGTQYVAPRNEMESRLVETFQEVLKRENIGVYDNFYDLGGDSIKSIQVVSRLKQKGFQLKIEDVLRTPIIDELAQKTTLISRVIDQGQVMGQAPLTAIQKKFFQEPLLPNKNHYNQSVLLESKDTIDIDALQKSLLKITHHHDALRMTYNKIDGTWVQRNQGIGNSEHYVLELHDLTKDIKTADKKIAALSDRLQASINIGKGPLIKVAVFKGQRKDLVLIVIHHLVIDGVSWRILLEDLSTLYKGFSENRTPGLPLKTDSFVQWSDTLQQYAKGQKLAGEHAYWKKITTHNGSLVKIPKTMDITKGRSEKQSFVLDAETTELLQTKSHSVYGTEINDVLLTALSIGINNTFRKQKVLIDLEGHGREHIAENMDITRTLGWFTSIYPVLLDISQAKDDPIEALVQTKENLRKIPNKGIGYGILKYLGKGFENNANTSIVFNYLGDFGSAAGSQNETEQAVFTYSDQYAGKSIAAENEALGTKLSVSGMLVMGQLQMSVSYNDSVFEKRTIELLIKNYETALKLIIGKLSRQTKTFLTPSDLTYKNISIEKVFQLNRDNNIQDIYRLSPLQEGMYYHWLTNDDKATYLIQKSFRLKIRNAAIENIRKSYEILIQRHDILRTEFSPEHATELVQVVRKNVKNSFKYIDLTTQELSQKQALEYIDEYKKEDRSTGFPLNGESQIRLSLIHLGNHTYEFIWSNHHIIMDGWCVSILINEFYQILTALNNNQKVALPKATPYVDYIKWLENIDQKQSLNYWKEYLADYNQKAVVPFASKNITDTAYKPAKEKIELQGDYLDRIRNVAKTNKTTENNLIQSVWGCLLSKYNNNNDVVFGTVVSGRPPQIKGIEDMIGLFINTIPVRVKYSKGSTVSQLLQSQQEKSIQSLENHYLRLSEVQAQSELGTDLIDHILVFENYAVQESQQAQQNSQIEVLQGDSLEQNHYDFSIQVNPGRDKMTIAFKYNQNRYDQKEIQHVTQHFQKILDAFVTGPNTLLQNIEYLSQEQRHELLHTFNDTKAEYPKDKTIIQLFQEQ
ncbi:condensation domain-containing protein, partial [Pseudozobellia sp. WGM2]|uniref:condensation domain-containing protein n=1 Tax=Pseudozobellia sp. WGM2 TaxID=2787625 RepID=UPI001FD79B95